MRSERNKGGHAVVELALFIPWIYLLFVGALDFGFYSYALINVQNAVRAAAVNAGQYRALSSDQAEACRQVLGDLGKLPNASAFGSGCSSGPLRVTVSSFTDSQAQLATRVQASYTTVQLLSIPGLVPSQITVTRTAEMRVYGD